MKKCDICGQEFSEAGLIFAKKKDGSNLLLCPECSKRIWNEMEKALLKGVIQNNDSDGD